MRTGFFRINPTQYAVGPARVGGADVRREEFDEALLRAGAGVLDDGGHRDLCDVRVCGALSW